VPKFDEFIEAIDDAKLSSAATSANLGDRPQRLQELRTVFHSPGVALVLGAGVSAAAGVPAWQSLLSNLVVKTLAQHGGVEENKAKVLADVYGPTLPSSTLVQARYLKKLLGGDFTNAVRAGLYAEAKESSEVQLLMALAKVCQCRESVPGGVKEIITYNFDRLVEDALTTVGRAFTVIDRGSFPKRSDLPIRHVHGFLGRTPTVGEWVVFSEDEYHEQYSDPFAWSNVIQLNGFSQRPCVFVGISLEDPNMRRLLEAVRRSVGQERPHFAFMRQTDPAKVVESVEFGWRNSGQPSGTKKSQVSARIAWLSRLADKTKEQVLADLGIKVIWYEKHEDLPGMLDSLRESGS
jgi:hypothetical protein